MTMTMDLKENNPCDYYDMLRGMIEEAERRAINRHKYYMSMEQGEDVGFETAARDWFQNYAKAWHENRMQKMLQMQREEISRYKWIESERARQDLGRSAVEEWVHKHAADWRVNWEASNLDDEDV
ncbi:MAG: hypothetical protein GXY07_03145 [Candidatus Hydrogenedentes bacterium]|nr:hypothetical protein [Candidatus Hydrogenedentota bacterium]